MQRATDFQGSDWPWPDGPQPCYAVRPPDRTQDAASKVSMRPDVAAPIVGWLCSGAGLVFGIGWPWVLGIAAFILGAVAVAVCAASWDSRPNRSKHVPAEPNVISRDGAPVDWPVNPRTTAL